MTAGRIWLPGFIALALLLAGCLGAPVEDVGLNRSDDHHSSESYMKRVHEVDGNMVASAGGPLVGSWNFASTTRAEVDFPDAFDNGTIVFTWEGETPDGLALTVFQGTDVLHQFEAASSPFEVTLDANDTRVVGATDVGAWAPAPGAAANVAWNAAFTFTARS